MEKNIGIIFADDMEYKPFEEYALKNGANADEILGLNHLEMSIGECHIHAIESGIGKVNSVIATCVLVQKLGVNTILNAGLSGAINNLTREDVVAGSCYVECDFDLRKFGYKLGQKPSGEYKYYADENLLNFAKNIKGMKVGKLGTGDFFLADIDKKCEYSNEFEINAFDMESASIASACKKFNVPFLSIRKISDDAQDGSVDEYKDMNNKCENTLTEVLIDIIKRI